MEASEPSWEDPAAHLAGRFAGMGGAPEGTWGRAGQATREEGTSERQRSPALVVPSRSCTSSVWLALLAPTLHTARGKQAQGRGAGGAASGPTRSQLALTMGTGPTYLPNLNEKQGESGRGLWIPGRFTVSRFFPASPLPKVQCGWKWWWLQSCCFKPGPGRLPHLLTLRLRRLPLRFSEPELSGCSHLIW